MNYALIVVESSYSEQKKLWGPRTLPWLIWHSK